MGREKKLKTNWEKLNRMKDKDIDFSECEEIPPEKFTKAILRKGLEPIPRKGQPSLRLQKILILFFILSNLFSACTSDQPPKEPGRPVYTMTVGGPAPGTTRSFSGVAQADKEIILSFRVPGQIIQFDLKVGQKVKTGEVLARLDPKDAELTVSQKNAALTDAQAKLQQAKADYERIRKLYESGSSSASELDSALAQYRSAQAKQETAEKDLELAKQQLRYTVLTAEVDGEVISKQAEVYETVAAGQELARMVTGDELKIEIGVPENLINYLSIGMSATVKFETLPNVVMNAQIRELGRSPTESTTYPVKLVLEKPDPRLRPGMVAEVTFIFTKPQENGQIVVPPQIIVGEGKERYVWVVDPKTQEVHKQIVKVGPLESGGLVIEEGLTSGVTLVTRGVHRLEEGTKVQPIVDDKME